RHREHLPRTTGRDRHRRRTAGDRAREQGHPDSLSVFDLAGADDPAGKHGPNQFVDTLDDRPNQGQPWRIPENRPALRMHDGRSQLIDLLPDAGLNQLKGIGTLTEPSKPARAYRIGIDVGGTFTKAVLIDNATHEVAGRFSVLTTHSDPRGVAKGVVDV